MKNSLRLSVVVIVLLPLAGDADEGWVSLFDGTTVERSPNTFLCRGPYGDFVLEFDVLCDKPLNSGVQIRSHTYENDTPLESKKGQIRKAGTVYGYQCEITKAEEG